MNELSEYKRLNLRTACVLRSASGGNTVGLPGEQWPTSDDGPMTLVCQLNLTSAPVAPEQLKDLALIALFVNTASDDWGEENGMDWVLRAYPTLEGLLPLQSPSGSIESRWQACDDFPSLDEPGRIAPDGFDDASIDVESLKRTKIGGWPSNIQGGQWWDMDDHPAVPRYCFQVVSDEKAGLEFGDGGTLYLARGTAAGCTDEWFLDWQCY